MGEYSIKKTFSICCAHMLNNESWGEKDNQTTYGKCNQIHGHNYNVTVEISAPTISNSGMIINFYELKRIFAYFIDERFDHKYLNDDKAFENLVPTAENMAKVFYDILWQVIHNVAPQMSRLKITVEETDGASASYTV